MRQTSTQPDRPQRVLCLVPEGASFFELSTPVGVFGTDRAAANDVPVELLQCGVSSAGRPRTTIEVEGGVRMGGLARFDHHLADADMVIVPTWPVERAPVPRPLVDQLGEAHRSGTRLVGLCLGAFVIAATGVVDHKSATTHWRYRPRFEEAHPLVAYEPNTLYVDHGSEVTSAGSAAALDCCLHLLRADHGADAAARVARSLVTAPHRGGAQSQFASAPTIDFDDDQISRALAAAAERIAEVDNVGDLAALAGVGRRSLERHMRARLGVTPGAWIDEQRIINACRLLEASDMSVEAVAAASGFGSTPTLRRALRARRDTTPTAYRAAFAGRSTVLP